MIQYNSPEGSHSENSILLNPLLSFILWFNAFYNKKRRIGLHVLMWLVFSILVELGLILTYHLSFYNSLFFLGRSLVPNLIMFYSFFYLIFPYFILKRRFLAGVLLCILSVLVWISVEHGSMILVKTYANLGDTGLKKQIDLSVSLGIRQLYTVEKFVGSLIYIMTSIAPLFCVKIIVDVTQSAYLTTILERDKTEVEMNFLKSQLNPNFLFNTLNSIYILNMKKDESASDVILELSDSLRYTLYESNTESVRLEKDLLFIENYINLEKVRQNKQTRIIYNCDMESAADYTIAPLLTFPFIENAFKYGLGTSLKDAWLEMETKVTDGKFYFSLRNSKNDDNNGEQLQEKGSEIGVENTKKRLALLYGGKHVLEITDKPDEYSVLLKINLKDE